MIIGALVLLLSWFGLCLQIFSNRPQEERGGFWVTFSWSVLAILGTLAIAQAAWHHSWISN